MTLTASKHFPMKEYKYNENTKLWVLSTSMTNSKGDDIGGGQYAFRSATMMLDCYNDRLLFQKECEQGGAVRYYMNLIRILAYNGVEEVYCHASASDFDELSFYANKENELIRN